MDTLQPQQRLRHQRVFEIIFKHGSLVKGRLLNVWVYQGPEIFQEPSDARPKLGVIVSRKTDLRATRRNRWKRMIREAFRRQQSAIKRGVAVLIQSKKQPQIPAYKAIEEELKKILSGAGVLK